MYITHVHINSYIFESNVILFVDNNEPTIEEVFLLQSVTNKIYRINDVRFKRNLLRA